MEPDENNEDTWGDAVGSNDDDENVEIIELKNLNPGGDDAFESQRQKDLEDTSFSENIHSTLYDRVLETDGSENLFVRPRSDVEGRLEDLRISKNPSTSAFDPNAIPNPKRDAGVIRRTIIYDKKQFINQVFGIKVNKNTGPYSKILYNDLKTTVGEKSGKINGATYKGKKILILMKGGRMEYSKDKSNVKIILDFKNTLNNALAEHNAAPASIVEDHISHEISEETVDNIVENAGDDMDLESFVILQNVEKNPLTNQEVRELMGVLTIDWTDLKKNGGKKIIKKKLEALRIEKENLKRKAFEAKHKKDGKEDVYNEMVRATELKIDSGRLMINEKPEGNLAVKILKMEADTNEMSKFDKFKKWSKENLLGLSAIAITIAGIIVTIVSATRTVIRTGATALSKFGKAVANVLQKFGPVVAAIGSVLATVLSYGGKGLLWLTQNLWLLAIALAYFLYNEYSKKK